MKRKPVPIKRAYKWAKRHITRCVLCQQWDVVHIGVFIPARPEHWPGQPVAQDKIRSFWYGVCQGCAVLGLDRVGDAVEQKLAASLN
jgi:hypothetical protein